MVLLGSIRSIWNVMRLRSVPAEYMDGFARTKNAYTPTYPHIHGPTHTQTHAHPTSCTHPNTLKPYRRFVYSSAQSLHPLIPRRTRLHSIPHKFNVSIALIAAYHCIPGTIYTLPEPDTTIHIYIGYIRYVESSGSFIRTVLRHRCYCRNVVFLFPPFFILIFFFGFSVLL